jgi:P27 family predicted phage terminase small subunit
MTRINTGARGQPRTARNSPDLRMITEIPTPPDYLDAQAVEIWTATAGLLIDRHDLTEGDLTALEVLAVNVSVFRAASRQLNTEGLTVTGRDGGVRAHPLLAVRKAAEAQVTILANLLGMTPQARRQLKLTDDLPGHHDKPQRGF